MGDRGVQSLVEALERNTSLKRLELQSNSITMVGCRLLSTVLRGRNMSIRRLLMGNNDADDPVIEVGGLERIGCSGIRQVLSGDAAEYEVLCLRWPCVFEPRGRYV